MPKALRNYMYVMTCWQLMVVLVMLFALFSLSIAQTCGHWVASSFNYWPEDLPSMPRE